MHAWSENLSLAQPYILIMTDVRFGSFLPIEIADSERCVLSCGFYSDLSRAFLTEFSYFSFPVISYLSVGFLSASIRSRIDKN